MSTFRVSQYPNDLTTRLIAQGCTPENHPGNVKWESGYGQFEYKKEFLRDRIYEMPCGLLWREDEWNGRNMGYGGVTWCHENDNPTVRCPYIPARTDCPLKDLRLGGGASWLAQCAGTPTDKPYSETDSLDAVAERERQADEHRAAVALKKFAAAVRAELGSFCPHHARWDRERIKWDYIREYDPNVCPDYCITQPCLRCGMRDSGREGNVLYDVHEHWRRTDGTFFDGEWNEIITRGVRYFKHARRLAICSMTAENPELFDWQIRNSREYANLYFEEHHWHGRFRVEVKNIRVIPKGAKDARDLMADLQAAKDGVTVIHASDQKKAAAETKKERREKAKAAKIRRMEQVVRSGQFSELEQFQQERIEKTIGGDRLEELMEDAARARSIVKPEQVSMFTEQDEGQ
ncbi:MAG: hypothetical protein PHS57_05910 [Alphaproteobacteria bacterium]|nr:hypothetical protein [Alphaproteobacteria bacterium]